MNTLLVTDIVQEDDRVIFSVNNDISAVEWKTFEPVGRILVDSDNKAFIYLLENDEGYHHLRIPHNHWVTIDEVMTTNKQAEVMVSHLKDAPIELKNFQEEMNLLLDNIKGNHNYGSEFVEEVEQSFKSINFE
ncbi:hypothetical protein CR194_09985 [Salipaludibacillus keqinensis]|uniref:Uncharacterized protein n=1 Tax=Salipaludibacillus keqinensis TaxID=2045207 RepID=A0A323TEN7_9BACI|nr:hypothetical protein [Salipaludibacillus keqinensis]PYZ93491.1 hypothetical protein CR194_09985 [Salipaludibacillus keqinensis]